MTTPNQGGSEWCEMNHLIFFQYWVENYHQFLGVIYQSNIPNYHWCFHLLYTPISIPYIPQFPTQSPPLSQPHLLPDLLPNFCNKWWNIVINNSYPIDFQYNN